MPVTAGPIYPGVKKGLVFAIDPANKDSWTGPTSDTVDSLTLYNPVSGSIFNDTSGSYGNDESFAFDGTDDFIETNTTDLLNGASQFTFAVWCYPVSIDNNDMIIAWRNGSDYSFLGWGSNNNAFVQTTGSNKYRYSANDSITENKWNYIVATGVTGASLNMYINGALSNGTNAGTMVNLVQSSNIIFGNDPGFSRYWEGNMGPVLLYNRALSAGEVLQNYNRLKGRFGLS
jgi:hypothetical protein